MPAHIVSVGAYTLIANISVDARIAATSHSATAHALAIAMKVLLVSEAVLIVQVGIAAIRVVCLDA